MELYRKTKASELALSLTWGLVELEDVVAWADSTLLQDVETDDQLISLSLAANQSDALRALNELGYGGDFWLSVLQAIQRISDIQDLTPRRASELAKHIYHLTVREDAPDSLRGLSRHWDSIDLAIDGVTGDPKRSVRAFLSDIRAALAKGTVN